MTNRIVVAIPQYSRSLAELHFRTHTESFRDFADASWIEARNMADYVALWEDRLAKRTPRECTWTALHDGQVIGTVTIASLAGSSRHFRPTSRHDHPDDAVACLRLMYVAPGFLRLGVGTRLLGEAFTFMRRQGYRMAVLITHQANEKARHFYHSRGWRLDAILEEQVEEFFDEPPAMRRRARYCISIPALNERRC